MKKKDPLDRFATATTHAGLKLLIVAGIIILIPVSIFVGIMLEFAMNFGSGTSTGGLFVVGVPVATIAGIVWLLHSRKQRKADQYHATVRAEVMNEMGAAPTSNNSDDIIIDTLSNHPNLTLTQLSSRTQIDSEKLLPILAALLRQNAISQHRRDDETVFSVLA